MISVGPLYKGVHGRLGLGGLGVIDHRHKDHPPAFSRPNVAGQRPNIIQGPGL